MYISKVDTLLENLRKLLRRGAHRNVRNILQRMHAADIAYLFRYLNEMEQSKIFNLLENSDMASEIISYLDTPTGARVLTQMDRKRAAEILQEMDPDDEVNILKEVDPEVKDEILVHLSDTEAESIEEQFQYPEDSAGRIMNTNCFTLHQELTVSQAIENLQGMEEESTEMVFYVYVVDGSGHLVGVCSLRQLLMVPAQTRLQRIMTPEVVSVSPETDQEEVAKLVERYDLLAVPVIDEEKCILGIVTVDDVIDVIRHEATEDIMKMVGTGDEYLNRSIFTRARMRMGWLLVAFLGEVVGIQFLNMFNATLQQVVALAFYLPIIIAMGGNIGSTSMTIVVRGLATGRISAKEITRVVSKELSVAVILGILYGGILMLLAYLQFGDVTYLGFVVGLSMLISMGMAAAIGTLVPFFLDMMKIDPAVATGPFVTSTVDSLGILVYLGTATMILS